MSDRPTALAKAAPDLVQARLLHRLFLTLFLRGRSARGLEKSDVPESIGRKLAVVLGSYAFAGAFSLTFVGGPVFSLSVWLHATTFAFLAMIIVASASESLFNKDEAEVLLHRPVTPQALLRAKVAMLVQIALWVAAAFNVVGLYVGTRASDGGWLFPVVHAGSSAMQAIFCTSCVMIAFQVCLRRFGRDRLDGLMSGAQILVSIAIIVGAQLMPRLLGQDSAADLRLDAETWWMALLPPVWFAGIDDALAGGGARESWPLAAVAVLATSVALYAAFERFARDYDAGWRIVAEGQTSFRIGRVWRWLQAVPERAPLRWWMRDPVARAGFVLTAAYLMRDRDVRLRIFPALVPVFVVPLVSITQGESLGRNHAWVAAFAGGFLGLIPMLALNLLRYSHQWRAADVFRAAPMMGPAPLWQGARMAVTVLLTAPFLAVTMAILSLHVGAVELFLLLLPGLITLPIYGLIPCVEAATSQLAQPADAAANVRRGILLMAISLFAAALSGFTAWAWFRGWFGHLLVGEALVAAVVYANLRRRLARKVWGAME